MKLLVGCMATWLRKSSVRSAMVRLRTHPHSGVEVPVRLTIHQPVTEGYCVVATQGGKLPEVNCQSVTELMHSRGNVNSIRQADGTSSSWRCEVRAAAHASERGFLREQERPAEQRPCAEETDEPEKPRRHWSVIGDRMAGSVGEIKQGDPLGTDGVQGRAGPKSRPMGVRASVVARKRLTGVEPRDAGKWNRENL